MTTFQWHFNQSINIFIQKHDFENTVCKMATILSRHHCAKQDSEMHDTRPSNRGYRPYWYKHWLLWFSLRKKLLLEHGERRP